MNIDYVLDENVKILEEFTGRSIGRVREEKIYEDISEERLRFCLAAFHSEFNSFFSLMNEANYHQSRVSYDDKYIFKQLTESFFDFRDPISHSKYFFYMKEDYEEVLNTVYLKILNGDGLDDVSFRITKFEPIFFLDNTIKLSRKDNSIYTSISQVNEGSYALIYKFKDSMLNQTFALKRAKENLSDDELIRFKKEFEIMKQLSSLYILKVYSFNETKNEFIMEYVNHTLKSYIDKNNAKLTYRNRSFLVQQLFNAFKYIHSKGLFHRDISLVNILVKVFDDETIVLKICDFGYLKEEHSTLTRQSTLFRGSLNDPSLMNIGNDKYTIQHEIYALTQVIVFIMTGKTNLKSITNDSINNFVGFGMNSNLQKRAKDLYELLDSFKKTNWEI